MCDKKLYSFNATYEEAGDKVELVLHEPLDLKISLPREKVLLYTRKFRVLETVSDLRQLVVSDIELRDNIFKYTFDHVDLYKDNEQDGDSYCLETDWEGTLQSEVVLREELIRPSISIGRMKTLIPMHFGFFRMKLSDFDEQVTKCLENKKEFMLPIEIMTVKEILTRSCEAFRTPGTVLSYD